MLGLFSYYKPEGITSAKFLNQLKRELCLPAKTKVGHGGTLDKFAEGLIIVAIGREYTRQLTGFLKNSQKEYEAEIVLGTKSTTDDPYGQLTKITDKLPNLTTIKNTLLSFPLNIPFYQTAPLFSAKKQAGKRLSDLAVSGQTVIPPQSLVTLYKLNLIFYQPPALKLKLLVSSGFYIRSFARDLGQKLKTGAYVRRLKRTKIINNDKTY